ncbi:MAG: flagellar motor protein MotB [Bacilli bacterium]
MKASGRRPKKTKVRIQKEIHERWLLTYSDLITLLLAFFIIMYSVASVNQGKFKQLAQSLHLAFIGSSAPIQLSSSSGGKNVMQHSSLLHQTPTPSASHASSGNNVLQQISVTPAQAGQVHAMLHEDRVFSNLFARLQAYIRTHNLQASLTAVNQSQGIQIAIRADILFDTGSDRLRPAAQGVLHGLVPFLDAVQNRIQVNGYTDSAPIHTTQFPSNWFLSVDRAAGVVQFLVAHGVAPTRCSAQGFSKYHPVASNTTASGMRQNRRVDIVILHSWA